MNIPTLHRIILISLYRNNNLAYKHIIIFYYSNWIHIAARNKWLLIIFDIYVPELDFSFLLSPLDDSGKHSTWCKLEVKMKERNSKINDVTLSIFVFVGNTHKWIEITILRLLVLNVITSFVCGFSFVNSA